MTARSLTAYNMTRQQMRDFDYYHGILETIKAGGGRLIWDIYWRIGSRIEATVRVKLTRFNAPLTDMELTGTYPGPAVKGNISESLVITVSGMDTLPFETDMAGTKPHPAVKGSASNNRVTATTGRKAFIYETDEAGTKPHPAVKGAIKTGDIELHTNETGQLFNNIATDADVTGIRPSPAQKGAAKDGGTVSPKVELTGLEFHVRLCGTGKPGG